MPPQSLLAPTAVPFLDLRPSNGPLAPALLDEIAELVETGAFTNGPQVAAFEEAFASYCGMPLCVGMGSGLDALRLALVGAGLERGDEVLVPAQTFVATYEAVTQAGGLPVVADVSEADYGLDPDAAADALSPRTRFVMPVHLYGQMADMRALGALAARHGLAIVEDACQAHGARRDGIGAGTAGLAAAFSFYPGKNLGAFGDAGALVTGDAELARQAVALREHGQSRKYAHDVEGYTARLDSIQALVLSRKLALLDSWNDERRAAAAYYTAELAGVGDLRLPPVAPGSDPVWHLYVVRTADPAALAGALRAQGIGSGRHYPEPPHLSRAYAYLGHRSGAFPAAEALARECLSLPLFPGIGEDQLAAVVGAIAEHFDRGGRAGRESVVH
ncbi:MAG TPA: DegT/DnrJ/EryC1/StrS family aminotransferase [Gaiellaceae bacterium]|nr:DegT/DnrJ/EryC1/StrS family aminotransferase [Gaiellaceae bacterium]